MIVATVQTIHIGIGLADWKAVLPELITAVGVLIMLMADAFVERQKVWVTTWLTLAVIVAAAVSTVYLWSNGAIAAMYAQVTSDHLAMFFNGVILLSGFLAVLLSPSFLRDSTLDPGEYYALLLAAITGMMLMAAGINFMTLFIALEVLSLSLYILSGFQRNRPRSQEAGFKYFLLSSFASAFLIYGMAFVYGATGTTQLNFINFCLRGSYLISCSPGAPHSPYLLIGIGLMLVGFAFKVSLVPFHMWTPDVYEGAPTAVTAFMSVTTKAAVFAAFIRVFNLSLSSVESHWFWLLWALAVLTMIVGNVLALAQTNMKRLLAYSGIAHAGYILVAMSANNAQGLTAVAFYFVAYAFTNIGAFALVSVLEARGQVGDNIADYRGLWYRDPALAGATAIFMFSLAGFPPTAGFFAKYLAFQAAVKAGHTELAVIGVLTSLISIYYYLRVIIPMFAQPERAPRQAPATSWWFDLAFSVAAAGTIALGIVPSGPLSWASSSVHAFMSLIGA